MLLNRKFNILLTLMALFDFLNPFSLLGDLVTTAGNIYNNERNLSENWNMQKDAQFFNKSEREASQVYNTSEREATQLYNSPQAQMERMQLAGINPNTAAGLVGGSSSSPASIIPTESPLSHINMTNPFNNLADLALLSSQIRNIDEDTRSKGIENTYKDESLRLDNEQKRTAIRLARSDIEYKKSLKGLTDKEIKRYDELQDLLINEGRAKIAQYESAVREYDAHVSFLKEQELTEQRKRKSMDASDAAAYASANASNASAGLSSAQMETEDVLRAGRVQNLQAETSESHQRTKSTNEDVKRKAWENTCMDNGILPNSNVATQLAYLLTSENKRNISIASALLQSARRAIVTTLKSSESSARRRNQLKYGKSRQWNP